MVVLSEWPLVVDATVRGGECVIGLVGFVTFVSDSLTMETVPRLICIYFCVFLFVSILLGQIVTRKEGKPMHITGYKQWNFIERRTSNMLVFHFVHFTQFMTLKYL